MVNKTKFYKTKVALAVVLSLGLAACGDSDGDEGSVSNSTTQSDATQNTVGNQDELTGTVQGVVVDTNGNPLEGVMVYLGDAETTTNAGGQYVFTNVGVTNVSGVNNEGNEAIDPTTSTLVVTIGSSATHLGALVTVTPKAQVNNTGGTGDAAGSNAGSNSDTTIQTFIDGFTAEAGIAVLPSLNAGAYGYVRDCRTGAPLTDVANILSLDFVNVTADNDVTTAIGNNGTQLTNAEDTHTIGTDAEGKFSLTGLAANSEYKVSAKEGWTITSTGTDIDAEDEEFNTNSEGSSQFLGTIEVCPVDFTPGENAAPYISSISNSIDPVVDDGFKWSVLKPGIDGTAGKEVVINFSEEMDVANIDLDKVVITKQLNFDDVNDGEVLVDVAVDTEGAKIISMSEDGKTMTIQLAEALPEMTKFSVWMPRWQYTDTYYAGTKTIVTGDHGTGESDDSNPDDLTSDIAVLNEVVGSGEYGITSDTINNSQFKTDYVRTRICTYVEVQTTVEGVTGEQLIQTLPAAQLPETAASWDNGVNGANAISNLNGQEAAQAGIDTGDRIATRWGITYDNDQARIIGDLGTLTTVADINVTHFRGATPQLGNITKRDIGDGTYEIDVDNAAHLDVVRLQPTAAFGIVGDNIDVDLLDLIAPTTTLQENYGLYAETGYDRDTADSGLVAAGEGGEVSVPGAAAQLGDPIVYIQPRHLSPVNTSNTADRFDEFEALAGLRTVAGNTLVDGDTNGADTDTDNPLYHAAEYAAWTDRSNPLGFAFSENIYVASGAAVGATANTALTNASFINSVTRNIDGQLITASGLSADLATVDVADMVNLANDDHNYVVQFEGLVADKLSTASTGDNTATADDSARVLLQDAMPAFITTSRWTGTTVEFTFNEPVVPVGSGADTTVFCFTNPTTGDINGDCADPSEYALTLDGTLRTDADANNDEDEGAYVLSADGMSLTVYVDGSKVQPLMVGSAVLNPQFFFNDDADASSEQHMAVSWDNLADANGNIWDTFDRDSNTAAEAAMDADPLDGRYLVDAPRFLAYDDVGPFEVTNARFIYDDEGGAGDADGNVTFTITFSHPLDLRDTGTPMGGAMDGAGWNGVDRSLDGTIPGDKAIIDVMFEIDLDGNAGGNAATPLDASSGTADLSVTISADYRTITLVTSEAANDIVALTTTISFLQLLDSSIIDNAQWATLQYVVTDTQ